VAAGETKPWDPVTALPLPTLRAGHLAGGLKKSCDPEIAVGCMQRERGDRAVAQLLATGTGEAEGRLAPRGKETDQLEDLPVGSFTQLDATFAH
jgi:hypothetical protein